MLIKYEQSLGSDRYRLGRIGEVHPDMHGKVRTVTVMTRDRRKASREKAGVCRAGLTQIQLPVQRLVVILPAGEAWGEGLQPPESS